MWDEGREQALIAECQKEVQAAVERFESAGTQPVESVIDHVYASWPAPWPSSAKCSWSVPPAAR